MRRMRWTGAALLALAATAVAAEPTGQTLLSKRYDFHAGVTLEIGATSEDGLRLDDVRFDLPPVTEDRIRRTAGLVTVRVAVSNTGSVGRRVGLAIALFDGEGRLLGVANGGSRMTRLRAGRQKTFALVFDGVYAEAHKATTFQISMESKP